MTKRGHTTPLREIQFQNERLTRLGIEPMKLSELRLRMPGDRLVLPERVDFYMLLLLTRGSSTHTVDFIEELITTSTLVFVRPSQVQQWNLRSNIEGHLVLINPSTLRAGRELELLALDEWPSVTHLSGAVRTEIATEMDGLRREFDRYDQSDLGAAFIQQLLMCLLLRLARYCSLGQTTAMAHEKNRTLYRLFIRALEVGFREQHGVKRYAERLGYSESTVGRACLAAEGLPAKRIIDRRVALEAKRMLAHSKLSVAEIGYELGFSEPTNFVKFFGRMEGCPPSVFRDRMISTASARRLASVPSK